MEGLWSSVCLVGLRFFVVAVFGFSVGWVFPGMAFLFGGGGGNRDMEFLEKSCGTGCGGLLGKVVSLLKRLAGSRQWLDCVMACAILVWGCV